MKHAWRVLALLLAVGLVVPAGASDAASTTSSTTIYAALVGDPAMAGRPTDLTAILGDGTDPVAGQTLTLSVRPWGAPSFVEVGHAVTDAGGSATVWVMLDHNATVRWTFSGSADLAASSLAYVVPIAPRVSRQVNDRTLRRGQRLVVQGRTFPGKAGCTVKLWRGELRPLIAGPRPVRLAAGKVRTDGSYRLAHRFHRTASLRLAVTVSACAGNARGLSAPVRVRVR